MFSEHLLGALQDALPIALCVGAQWPSRPAGVVEYELTGTSTRTDRRGTAAFIGVLTARDGRITLWREYQNTLAIQQVLA